jgi:hypothetical protein
LRHAWHRYFESGFIEFHTQLVAILCREMKWRYEDYLAQPTWFIAMLLELMRAEGNYLKERNSH